MFLTQEMLDVVSLKCWKKRGFVMSVKYNIGFKAKSTAFESFYCCPMQVIPILKINTKSTFQYT